MFLFIENFVHLWNVFWSWIGHNYFPTSPRYPSPYLSPNFEHSFLNVINKSLGPVNVAHMYIGGVAPSSGVWAR